MKLVEVQVTKFRNILDSGKVKIQPDVTCLVGKIESGKTSFLHALHRLRPARANVEFDARKQYPAWRLKKDERAGIDLDDIRPVQVKFELDAQDVAALDEALGEGVLKSKTLSFERAFNNRGYYNFSCDEKKAVQHLLSGLSLPKPAGEEAAKCETLRALRAAAVEMGKEESTQEASQTISQAITATYGEGSVSTAAWNELEPRVPKLFYFDVYSSLPYSVNVREVLTAKEGALDDEQHTARTLLRMAGADDDYLLDPDYEERKRELEHVANALTEDVLEYWSQNRRLRVEPDITKETVKTPQGQQAVVEELKIRIRDERHRLTLPFDEHSTGFQWFFSFLAAFSEYEDSDVPVVILLDEPGLGLHARAQADFLRFIDERLTQRHQVIFTTHSPFMVQPGKLERVRMVEDTDRDEGSKVSAEILSTDRDTLFPLQSALGYDLVQHLFIAPDNLIVEGTSDYTYLQVISDHFKEQGEREHLDERWSIIPVGGAECVPTFVALLGNHLEVTVLVDSQKKGHQRLMNLAKDGILDGKRIIKIGDVTGAKLADIEDLFTPDDYLPLFNKAFGKTYKVSDLNGTDPIVSKLARLEGIDRFDHGKPADVFLRTRDAVVPKLAEETLDNFESLFKAVNATLPGP